MTLLSNEFRNQESVQNRQNRSLGISGDAQQVILYDSLGNELNLVATATLSNVSGSASSVTVLAANTSRKGVIIHNDSSAILYIKFGATASTSSFTYRLNPFATYEMRAPIYQGVIDGIWASATGNARVTELT